MVTSLIVRVTCARSAVSNGLFKEFPPRPCPQFKSAYLRPSRSKESVSRKAASCASIWDVGTDEMKLCVDERMSVSIVWMHKPVEVWMEHRVRSRAVQCEI